MKINIIFLTFAEAISKTTDPNNAINEKLDVDFFKSLLEEDSEIYDQNLKCYLLLSCVLHSWLCSWHWTIVLQLEPHEYQYTVLWKPIYNNITASMAYYKHAAVVEIYSSFFSLYLLTFTTVFNKNKATDLIKRYSWHQRSCQWNQTHTCLTMSHLIQVSLFTSFYVLDQVYNR